MLDPVIGIGGDRSTSNSFILLQAFSELALGTSTASSFQINPGFLAFPTVTLPTVTATAGDGKVTLSWTGSTGAVGWTVAGYSVGQSITSGGPYTYTSLGNITSSPRTGLTNGTAYYFVILPEDAFGVRIATSTQVSATPAAAALSPVLDSGGGTAGRGRSMPVAERRAAILRLHDLNGDRKMNIRDLSILLYYFGKPLSERSGHYDLNNDSKIDIIDVSILLYYWID